MGKDNALGYDPLGWIKTAENNKSVSAEVKYSDRGGSQTGSQKTPVRPPVPVNSDKSRDISKSSQPQNKINNVTGKPQAPKPRVVIGRMYEKPSVEKLKPATEREREYVFQGLGQPAEPLFQGDRPFHQHINSADTYAGPVPASSSGRFSVYIIIAYTALMLALGYIVYNDVSNRVNRLEARLFAIEKALRAK